MYIITWLCRPSDTQSKVTVMETHGAVPVEQASVKGQEEGSGSEAEGEENEEEDMHVDEGAISEEEEGSDTELGEESGPQHRPG
jgi:hypothetical protein